MPACSGSLMQCQARLQAVRSVGVSVISEGAAGMAGPGGLDSTQHRPGGRGVTPHLASVMRPKIQS